MTKTKVLILGASGFIGRNLALRFAGADQFEVTGTYFRSPRPTIDGITTASCDLTDPGQVKEAIAGQDIVIQAAATTSGAQDICKRPYYHVTDNAVMNSYIFRSAYESQVKNLIFFSCTVMYPSRDSLRETDFDANEPLNPRYFGVGWTKVYLEKMAEFYSRLGETKHTVIRHSNIYGPYDKFDLERSHVFGATMTKVLDAKGQTVEVWGTGQEKRDLLYVDDLTKLVELAMLRQKAPFELINAGCGSAISINDLVHRIIKASGKPLDIVHNTDKPSIPTSLSLNCERAFDLFGWKPEVSLEEGIERTMKWHRENLNSDGSDRVAG